MLLPEALHAPSHVGLLAAGSVARAGPPRQGCCSHSEQWRCLKAPEACKRPWHWSCHFSGQSWCPKAQDALFFSARWQPYAFGTHVRRSHVDLLASQNNLVNQGRSTLHFVFYMLVYGHG